MGMASASWLGYRAAGALHCILSRPHSFTLDGSVWEKFELTSVSTMIICSLSNGAKAHYI